MSVRIRLPGATRMASVDERDAERVRSRKWRLRRHASGSVVPVTDLYDPEAKRGRECTLGRFVAQPRKGERVIAKNGDPFDVRRANLRVIHRGRLPTFRRRR